MSGFSLGFGLSLGLAGKAGGPKHIASPSSYFDWFAALGLSAFKQGSAYSSNYTLNMFKPAVTGITIYVDYATGDNTLNDGLSWATPKKTLRGAITPINAGSASQVHRVVFKGGLSPCSITAQFSRPVVFESFDGGRLKHINVASETPVSWTKTAGQTNVYEGTPTGTVSGVVDVSAGMPGYPSDCPRYYRLTSVADVATCDATPNSYFYDSATPRLYVHTFDNRAADISVWQINTSNSLTFAAASGVASPTFWADRIDAIGGSSGLMLTETFVAGGVPAYRAYMNRCTGQYGSQDGITHRGLGNTIQYRCGAYGTFYDGFSSWGMSGASNTDPAGNRVEIECYADQCGGAVDGTTNSSTLHSLSRAVTINCDFRNAKDKNIHDINMSKRWWLGGVIGPSRTATGAGSRSLQAGNGADQVTEMWVDGATFPAGSLYTLNTTALAAIRINGAVPSGVTIDPASAGTITTY